MATRFYFQASSTPGVSPPLDAGWSSVSSVIRRLMATTKVATTEQVTGPISNAASSLAVQAVSPPLAAQTISGTVSLVSRGRELASTDNVDKRFRAIRVYASNGSTLRGTLVAYGSTASTTELSGTTLQGQQHALNNALSSVACLDGDIIVVEFGYGVSTTGTTPEFTMEIGGSGTDHANANADVTGTVPWVEFSQNLTFFSATVALTPATATATAQTVTATPAASTVTLTPAVQPITANAQVITPGVVTVALTPATGTRTAIAVTPTPLAPVVALTPATATATGIAATATPGPVTTSILPGLITSLALAVAPQSVGPSVALTTATGTLTPQVLTVTPLAVNVPLTPATATTSARLVTLAVGPVTAPLTAAPATLAARPMTLSVGPVTAPLTTATATAVAVATNPVGVPASGTPLTLATLTVTAQPVSLAVGPVTAPLTPATRTLAAVALTATPGPVTVGLTAAAATAAARQVTATPGPAALALTAALMHADGVVISPSAGMITVTITTGTGVWSARAVVPGPVEGVLLHPATAVVMARKLKAQGQLLPLNNYEYPLAHSLLESMREVLTTRTLNPPLHYALRVGEQVAFDLSENEDLCCDGLAYVKINRVYASSSFPAEDEGYSPCGPMGWAADLEMGILRCAPVGTPEYVASDQEWEDATYIIHNDSAAMREALNLFRSHLEPDTEWVARSWLPVGPGGACVAGTQIVTVGWIPC